MTTAAARMRAWISAPYSVDLCPSRALDDGFGSRAAVRATSGLGLLFADQPTTTDDTFTGAPDPKATWTRAWQLLSASARALVLRYGHDHQLGDDHVRRLLHGKDDCAGHVRRREANSELLIEILRTPLVATPAVKGKVRVHHSR